MRCVKATPSDFFGVEGGHVAIQRLLDVLWPTRAQVPSSIKYNCVEWIDSSGSVLNGIFSASNSASPASLRDVGLGAGAVAAASL